MWIINKIGMKSIKIASAVTLSLLIGNLFKFGSPYLMALTSVIGIQSTKNDSVTNAKDRITGTLIGIITGSITVRFLSSELAITVIGVFLIIYICNLLKLKNSIVQANMIYLSVMLLPSPDFNPLSVIISIVIGVLIAIIINFLISPFEIMNNLHNSYNNLRQNIVILCSQILTTSEDIELRHFNLNVMSFKSLIKAYDNEYLKMKHEKLNLNEINILNENIDGISFFIYTIEELKNGSLTYDNIIRVNKALNIEIKSLETQRSENDDLFNFHVDKLLDYLEKTE